MIEGYKACEPIIQLELSDDSMNSLIADLLARSETSWKRQSWFQAFGAWLADRQLGFLNTACAIGLASFLILMVPAKTWTFPPRQENAR